MLTNIDHTTIAKAWFVANRMRAELLYRIAGSTDPGSCSQAILYVPPMEVVDIAYPGGTLMGLWSTWCCHLRQPGNPKATAFDGLKSIREFFCMIELHAKFRLAFGAIGMPTEHLPCQAHSSGTGFVCGGATASVKLDRPVYVRPVGDRSKSLWQNAQIRLDRDVVGAKPGTLIVCRIDPFENHYRDDKYQPVPLKPRLEFAAEHFIRNELLPIVRVQAVWPDDGSAVLEPHEGVEFYQP